MEFSDNPHYLSKIKKVFTLDFILFACISLVFWIIMLYAVNHSISFHSYFDEHTRQALAWQKGKITLDANIDYLEISHYKDKYYVSFPPVPSIIEFPLTYVFGSNTPNTFTLLLFTWVGMLFAFFILLKLTKNRILSYIMAFSFYWGSTILYLSLEGAVWHQGQLYGLFFAITAFLILVYTEKPVFLLFGGFCLALAVGCRPFYLFMTPFYGYHAYKRFPHLKTLIFIVLGLIPPGVFYAIYNFIRFDSIIEFGHRYIPWSKSLPNGVFSFAYFANNIYHAFINPPEWSEVKNILSFNGAGTGLWFSSPVILLGFAFFLQPLYGFFRRMTQRLPDANFLKKLFHRSLKGEEEKIPLAEIIFSISTILVIWFGLLLHESNGWFQFGYRFSVDLIPILLILFGRTFRKPHIFLIPICQFAIIINVYGALWFYVLRI
ncbi:MAG: hypothetical protein JXJ04_10425 [Spirochaetales bacterium]|nr:hypothetical protein [Spirochaetales bacterium]